MAIGNPDIETARVLYLVYGTDAVEMAELRCRELAESGDAEGLATWTRVLTGVKVLIATDPGERPNTN
jgi:hypothetical protein